MIEYKLEFSKTSIPYSEHSRVLNFYQNNKAFAISNNTLYEFEFSNDAQPTIRTSKDKVHPLGNAKLLFVEPFDKERTAIIVKVTQGIRIYIHSKDSLRLAVEDDQYHDVFEWNMPGNIIQFGHFYHDSSILSMMSSHVKYGTKFFAVFKDVLLSGEFPIYPLETNVDIFEKHSPNSSVRMLADLNRNQKNSIVSRNRDGLSFFELNKANGIDFVMKVPHGGAAIYDEGIFFTDLTHQKYNDIVHLNSSGLFIYQYDENYKFIHYNPLFSEAKGWTADHTKTIQFMDINRDGYVDMVFTGPKGIAAITFKAHENMWHPLIETTSLPPSMRHAVVMNVVLVAKAENSTNNCYLFTHLDGSIHWAKLVNFSVAAHPQEVDTFTPPARVIATTGLSPLQTSSAKAFKPIPLLRDMNIWSGILNCVDRSTGKPKFSLPLVNLKDPLVKFILYYDATSTINDVSGIGWSMPLNLITMDDNGSIFDDDVVFVIAFQDSPQALILLPKESNSIVRTYTLPSRDESLKFRAKFYPKNDQWVVDLGNGIKQLYGQIQPGLGACSKEIVWQNWHGPGFDSANQVVRSRMWYLAKVQDELDMTVLEFSYDVRTATAHSGMEYTTAVYLKKTRDYQGNEIEFRYQEKETAEYKTYDVQDQEGNYNWELLQTRYLQGYTFTAPSQGTQEVTFKYHTSNGLRFLTEIRQSKDVIDSYVAKFEYLTFPMGKFSLKNVRLPYDVEVEFTHSAVVDVNSSSELKRIDVMSDYKVTIGDEYVLVSFINGNGQVVLRMFNNDMSEELYTSESQVKMTHKGRWPQLGENGSVVGHEVIRGDDYFGVILFYSASKWLCLFGHAVDTGNWLKKSDCHEYGEESTMQAGKSFCLVTDPASKVELFEWKPTEETWNRQTIISNVSKIITAVHHNKFVTYDDSRLYLGYKASDTTWKHKPLDTLYNCTSETENIFKRFDLKESNYKLIAAGLRNNMLKFNHNLIALNCLKLNNHQLESSLQLYTIDRLLKVSAQQQINVMQDNLWTFVTDEEKDSEGNYFTFTYFTRKNGDYYIRVADFRGPLLENLKANNALDQKNVIKSKFAKALNSPAKRLLIDLQKYIMSFSDKVIVCNDQKLTFGGNLWQQTNLTDTERKRETLLIPLGDKFLLEKKNKEDTVKLLQSGTRKLLSDLTVNLADVRVFYPVYIAIQMRALPVRLLEFNDAEVNERELSISESLSPYTNPLMLITHEGDASKTVIFRQQYGIRRIKANYVLNKVTVKFDKDRKKRVTGYEYSADSVRLVGNTAVYSKFTIIPANNKSLYGWLVQSLNNGSSIAYNNQGEIVRHIPFEDKRSNDELETDEEEAFRIATTIYDKSSKLEIAKCSPFRLSEEAVGYYGFEDYEVNAIGSSKRWNFNSSNVIRNGFSLTGRNYLHQSTEAIEGIFQPIIQNGEYIASTWVRLSNITEIPQIGIVTPHLKAMVLTSTGNEVISLLSEVKLRIDDWIYLELIVDLHMARKESLNSEDKLQIAIRVGPSLTTPIDIDHVRFVPLISDFSVNVFDAVTHLNTAVIESTGTILRRTYDVYNTVVCKINEQNQLDELTVFTKAGVSNTPYRSTVRVKPQIGFYEQFSPFSFANRWKITKTSPWRVAPYQLEHYGEEWEILQLNTEDIATESYGFRVLYSLSGDHASFTICDFVELSKSSNHCQLKVNNKKETIQSEGEILLIKESDRLFVWIDGGLYIDQMSSDIFNNGLKFAMRGRVSFKDMMVFSNASIKVTYQNSLDEPIQEIFLESAESVVVKERLYDELGRQRITTQHVRIVRSKIEPLLTYIPNFVTNGGTDQLDSIWKTGLLDGLATRIIGHAYGFGETKYDSNPLNEKTSVGLPGKEFSTAGNFAKRFTSKTTNLFVANRYPLTMNVSYQIEQKLGGIEDIKVLNSKNKKIAHFVHVPGSKDIFSTYKLNDDGQLLQALPPLYFEIAGSFHKMNADLLTVDDEDYRLQRKLGIHIDYNKNGKPIRKTTADAGPLENIYDDDKLLRFILYFSYTKPTVVETIVYFTYDEIGRILSTGQLMDTKIPKNKLLSMTLNKNNSVEYQSFNYANFERDPNLRGRLLRTITMNDKEPFAEVINVNNRGDTVDKRIILPNLTKKPDIISISKSYFAGRLRAITYPALFFGQPFTVVYGYDKLGRVNSIGIPEHPSEFLQITHNAAGQITEETYEPGSVYTFKHRREYNEPGFLIKMQNPFQSEEISYTDSSYGGANRGDGSVTRIKFTSNWFGVASSVGISLNPNSFVNDSITPKDSKTCFEALKHAGYLDAKNRQLKAFYPDLEIDFPIICTSGTTGRHISNVLGRNGFPREYGYRFDYSAHQDLTKAKYFIGSDELDPLQPDTFAKEIAGITTDSSRRIWSALKSAQFLVEDPDRTNLSTSHGKEGRRSFIGSNLFEDLKNINPDYVFYTEALRKILTSRYFKSQGNVTLPQMQNLIRQWMGNLPATIVQRAGTDIFEMLRQKRYFLNPLEGEFQNVLKEFQPYYRDIVRVLFTHFGRQLGRSEFDVESYHIDANGNHRTFNTGYDHYDLKYETESNRVEGIQYKAFDKPQPQEIFRMQHDSRGNVIQAMHKRIKAMQYHPVSNFLQRVKMVDGSSVQFYYDRKGERVLKRLTDPTGKLRKEMHYLRDDQGRTLVERELNYLADNQPPAVQITMYVYSAHGLVGFVRRDQFYSVITDHQGSVRLILRDGEVVAAYDYLPYGNLMRIFGADSEAHIPYRYTGQEWDPEIGLYNYHARFYDPSIGRFYQIDPKEQYFSPYKYAGNSPVSMVDPSGEIAFMLIFAIASMVVGAYLGGAGVNGSWNFIKWNWKSIDTYIGIFFGGLTGYFLPGGIVTTVVALKALGMAVAIGITVSAGLSIAYLSAASANGSWNPKDWDFSSPRTWSALFDGFAMGSSAIGSLRQVGKYYKQLQATGKKLFVGVTFVAGTGLFVMGGIATDWDVKKPQFWFATVSSLASAPELTMFAKNGLKATKTGWKDFKDTVGTVYKNFDDYVDTFFYLYKTQGRSLGASLREIYVGSNEISALAKQIASASAVGIGAYLLGSALNHGFTNWNMTDLSTYQNILTAIQVGGQTITTSKHGIVALRKKLRLKKAQKALVLTDEIAISAGKLYKELIRKTETVPVIENGVEITRDQPVIPRESPHYNDMTISRLGQKRIPNTAMSIMVAGDIAIVGFSSNRAPGVYLVYSHDNLSNPTFKAEHYVTDNGMLAGRPVAVRDDPRLTTKISNSIDDIQNGIKQDNMDLYVDNNLHDVLTNRLNSNEGLNPHNGQQLLNMIENEIMTNGFVSKNYIAERIDEFHFENENIRLVNDMVQQAQREVDNFQFNRNIEDPFELATLEARQNQLIDEVNRLKTDLDVTIAGEKEAYMNILYEPVKTLSESLTHWDIANCAEPHTMLALERQSQIFDKVYYKRRYLDIQLDIDYMATYKTAKLPRKAIGFQRCGNCVESTKMVPDVLTDNRWMDNLKTSFDEALLIAKESQKNGQFLTPIIALQKTIAEEKKRKNAATRQRRSAKEDTAAATKWYKNPIKWMKNLRSIPKNNSSQSHKTWNKTILEFGDEFVSQIDVNGTLLLTDVILAKYQQRKLHQISNNTSCQLNTAELVCNIVQLFEDSIEKVAAIRGISKDDLNVDSFAMQQEVMPYLRKCQFEEIYKILSKYVMTALDDKLTEKTIDHFREAIQQMKLNQSIEKMFIRMMDRPELGAGIQMAYNASHSQQNLTDMFDRIAALPYDQKFLNYNTC